MHSAGRCALKVASVIGGWLARYLSAETGGRGLAPPTPAEMLGSTLRPADVVLVEGTTRVSSAIKYLTHSTWSHALLYVGTTGDGTRSNSAHAFVEADMVEGVRIVGMDAVAGYHSRICRPAGLDAAGCAQVCDYAIQRVGYRYDMRNVVDLARYLLPNPPVPPSWRRSMLALGSGDPTRAICSTLIAQAFQSVRYPILPEILREQSTDPACIECFREVLKIRHHSLFTPRDFDVSPYFAVVKATLAQPFDFRALPWRD